MNRAEVTLPGDLQILIKREFDAPRERVYEAWTTPELLKRWWSAKRGEMTVAEVDLRVGGSWRFAMVADSGMEVAFHGEYREVAPAERLVFTSIYEAVPQECALNTLTLVDRDGGGTAIEMLVEHTTQAARDMHVASGMEDGLQDALDLLEETASV
jgi:uncharacterized protein YndB with AHSA1/START domain